MVNVVFFNSPPSLCPRDSASQSGVVCFGFYMTGMSATNTFIIIIWRQEQQTQAQLAGLGHHSLTRFNQLL